MVGEGAVRRNEEMIRGINDKMALHGTASNLLLLFRFFFPLDVATQGFILLLHR